MIPASHALECADVVTSSDDYARRFAGEVGAWMVDTQSEIAIRMVGNKGYKTALDVGGGHGQLLQPFLKCGITTTVLGSSDACRGQIDPLLTRGQCAFTVGSLTALPFEAQSFDLVSCIRFLSHCEEWPRVIAELCRVARHGVFVDYPPLISSNLIAPITFRIKKLIEGNTRPFSIFLHTEIEREFLKAGFRRAAYRGQFFFPMAIHRLVKSRKFSRAIEAGADALGLRGTFGSPTLAHFVRDQ